MIIRPDADAVAQTALDFLRRLYAKKGDPVLGLATGNTPLKLYA